MARRAPIGRYEALDDTDGGNSHRFSLTAEWHRDDGDSKSSLMAYGVFYDLDLYSDFTYFLASPQSDQFEQTDRRFFGGVKASHLWRHELLGRPIETTVGLQTRSDFIHNGLFQTEGRTRRDKVSQPDENGVTSLIPAVTREDRVGQTSISPYVENKAKWADKFRSVLGLRADYYHFDVANRGTALNSGTADELIASPKAALLLGACLA